MYKIILPKRVLVHTYVIQIFVNLTAFNTAYNREVMERIITNYIICPNIYSTVNDSAI